MLRWIWLGRAALACAILAAAVFAWSDADPSSTLVATLAFAGAMIGTGFSMLYLGPAARVPGQGFYVMQCLLDLLLVTAVVHVTGGWSSQFAALYVLVIASGALLLSFRGGMVVAAAACALYAIDIVWLRPGTTPYSGLAVQLGVFVVVAVGSGYVVLRLRQAGLGRDELTAQLITVQLEAADILRTIRSGILTVDSRGFLLYANPAASELLGVDLRGHAGRPVIPLLSRTSPRLAELLELSARDHVRTTRAEAVIHRDGRETEIGVTTTVADTATAGGAANATAIFQDISDTKRLQALHVRAERFKAVAELSASLAHEIRNPLASIRSATEQLSRRRSVHADADDDENVLYGLIVREADRLSSLLADFLDFARARVTRHDVVDLSALVHNAAALAAAHPDRRATTTVTVDVASDLPHMRGDEDLLHRAVFNLVLNSVQALGDRAGHVFVEVDRYRPASPGAAGSLTGELLAISVTDDGPGIPPEIRDRLFEPFVTSKHGGSGLGLPVVHRAVEAHSGLVLVDALPQGTRFIIVLPMIRISSDPAFAITSSSDHMGVAA